MGIRKKTITVYFCERCDHEWLPRRKEKPIICPKCKSAYWNKPRRQGKEAHSCDEFKTLLPDFFRGKRCSIVLTRHCLPCGGAMVIRIDSGIPEYRYFEVGSTSPSTEPFICKEIHPDQKRCIHNWIMLVDSLEDSVDYLTGQKHWCSHCGDYCELPREKLPVKGYV